MFTHFINDIPLPSKFLVKLFKALFASFSYLFYLPITFLADFMAEKTEDRLIFFDFETTGLNMFHDKIIEYCFQDAYNPDLSIQSMIDPERKFEFIITKITGIYPDDLIGKPKIHEKIEEIVDFIDPQTTRSTYLVAHNVDGFDAHVLRNNLQRYGEEYVASYYHTAAWRDFKYIDTIILAKKLDCIPTKKYSLKAICEYYDITPGNHRADGDTDSLMQVYRQLLQELSHELVLDADWLYENPFVVYEYIYG